MAITPVSPISAGVTPVAGPGSTTAADPASGEKFGSLLATGIDNLQQVQTRADGLAAQAAVGQLSDVHDLMIASTQASLATELTVAVRNRAVDAFNEIMRMQI
ncbi:MAG TPA: flagellar hook-basal body complex protein FliE [Acidimicrobiales bacterium]|nr:flagellar hook-basal body complex protein FliE [Acidimicrobiales bacterium]